MKFRTPRSAAKDICNPLALPVGIFLFSVIIIGIIFGITILSEIQMSQFGIGLIIATMIFSLLIAWKKPRRPEKPLTSLRDCYNAHEYASSAVLLSQFTIVGGIMSILSLALAFLEPLGLVIAPITATISAFAISIGFLFSYFIVKTALSRLPTTEYRKYADSVEGSNIPEALMVIGLLGGPFIVLLGLLWDSPAILTLPFEPLQGDLIIVVGSALILYTTFVTRM